MKSSRINGLTNLLRRAPGGGELAEIIEFLPKASLISDSDFGTIFLSNKKAREISSYKKNELKDLSLKDVLPNLKELCLNSSISAIFPLTTNLIQHSGMQISVNINVHLIGSQKQWALLTFDRDDYLPEIENLNKFSKQKWLAIHTLSKIALNQEKIATERQILHAGSLLTGASLLGLYRADTTEQFLVLKNAWGNSKLLSKKFSFKEVEHLQKPLVWEPGSNSTPSLQKSVLSANSKYIATMPLYVDDPHRGILLIANQDTPPPRDLLEQLTLLVTTLNAFKSISQIKISDDNTPLIHKQPPSLSQSIENAISDGLILVSENLKIINLNSTAENSLGYKTSEVKGEDLQDILIGMDSILINIEEIKLSESIIHDFGNIRIRRRDSQAILLHIRAMPIFYDEKNILAILISDQSQQEEIQAEANRLREQALLGEYTATFAHEVRNPINNISTSLQLMEMKFPDNNEIQKQIGRMKHDINRLSVLINKILSYSKTREHNLMPLDFKTFIKNLTDRWGNRFKKNNIESSLIISRNIPQINADENALEQVFTNLISNAVRAMQDQDKGVLVIKVDPLEENGVIKKINIDISDNGPGIPKEIQEKIFKPFFTTNNDGTGLGLAVSKRIISSHNGEISLKSFPGGTVFNIKLPTI